MDGVLERAVIRTVPYNKFVLTNSRDLGIEIECLRAPEYILCHHDAALSFVILLALILSTNITECPTDFLRIELILTEYT